MPQCQSSLVVKMKSNKNVLILSAGRRVELVFAFQDALSRHFSSSKVFTTDLNPQLSAACHVSDKAFCSPRADSDSYIDYLLGLCVSNEIGLVVPTIDPELLPLALNRERFEDIGVSVVISKPELVSRCRDKRETSFLFEQVDIPYPKIMSKDQITTPCFCKPYDGSCSKGAFPIFTNDALTEDLLEDEKNIFMELVGPEFSEYTVDCYYASNGELKCIVPRERIEVRGGEVSKGATRKNFVYDFLYKRLHNLCGALGCITLQVFVDPIKKSIIGLEINPRFGGGFPLSNAAGADFTDWLIKEYLLGQKLPFYDLWSSDLVMLRYDAKVIVNATESL